MIIKIESMFIFFKFQNFLDPVIYIQLQGELNLLKFQTEANEKLL